MSKFFYRWRRGDAVSKLYWIGWFTSPNMELVKKRHLCAIERGYLRLSKGTMQ